MFNRGVERRTTFVDDRDRTHFLARLGAACVEHGVEVHAWCLMTNHYHLLVRARREQMSTAMHQLGTRYVRTFNDRWQRDGPLFRGRFGSVPVVDEAHLRWLARYVHRNPIAIDGADRLVAYRWSSLRDYLGMRRPPSWVVLDHLTATFGGTSALERFVLADDEPALTGAGLDAAIDQLVDDHTASSPTSARAARSVVATVLARADADSAPITASARSRTRQRLAADPALRELVERVERLAA